MTDFVIDPKKQYPYALERPTVLCSACRDELVPPADIPIGRHLARCPCGHEQWATFVQEQRDALFGMF